MEQMSLDRAIHLTKRTFNYFLIGTVSLLPVLVVAQIVVFLVNLLLRTLFNVNDYTGNYGATFLALAGVFGVLAFVGRSVSRRGRSFVVSMFDALIARVPLLSTVYRVTQRLIELFRTKQEEAAREVVYVEFPKDGMWSPAYMTNREGDRCVLFVPTAPNPTNGYVVVVHQSRIRSSSLDMSEVTGLIVSMGADFPKIADELGPLPLADAEGLEREIA